MKVHSPFKLIDKLLIGSVICSMLALFTYNVHSAHAAPITDFDAGNIIDNAVFYNKDSMSVQQIQNFLNTLIPNCDVWGTGPSEYGGGTRAQYAIATWGKAPPYPCLNVYHENPNNGETSFEMGGGAFTGGISAAQIIYNAAQTYNINPKVLLVMLKKESAGPLTADNWPLKSQYKYAMGYACPDSGPNYSANCDNNKAGFYKQMMLAAWQLNYYKEHPNDYSYHLGWNDIQYSPNINCGTKRVYIENMATLSLYIYTPYTPNDAALAAYPGQATCGAYGNRNFYQFYKEWFGTTRAPIPDGLYKISTKLVGNLVLGSTPDGRNIQQNWDSGSATQKFLITLDSATGYYRIKNVSTGKLLDVSGGIIANSTKLWQWTPVNYCAQLWNISQNEDLSYEITSACNGRFAIDIPGGNLSPGVGINIYTNEHSVTQKWNLTDISSANASIPDGTYKIATKLVGNLVLGSTPNGQHIQQGWDTNSPAQKFNVSLDRTTGYYKITNASTGKLIDVAGGIIANSTKLWQWTPVNYCAQQWNIVTVEPSVHQIRTACNDRFTVDIPGGHLSPGIGINIYSNENSVTQKWVFIQAT